MLNKKVILKSIQNNKDELASYGVKRIGIFGSFATAKEVKNSDIDVIVEFRKGEKAFDNYMAVKFYMERLFHRKVDLVIKDALKPRIKGRILSEVLYA